MNKGQACSGWLDMAPRGVRERELPLLTKELWGKLRSKMIQGFLEWLWVISSGLLTMSVQKGFVVNGPRVPSRRHSRAQINFFY